MPPKVGELVCQLLSAGFVDRGGKGSHRNFRHSKGVNITISGRPGDDAKHYQIRDVKQAIDLVRREK
jgi:predicted RNA binding protein YcfA (HicA-like mRNA interferase family)